MPWKFFLLWVFVLFLGLVSTERTGKRAVATMPQTFLERGENCKSVSIPAKSTCAPGLVCNPNTGTCVPIGTHLQKGLLKKKIFYRHFLNNGNANSSRLIFGSISSSDDRLQEQPWS